MGGSHFFGKSYGGEWAYTSHVGYIMCREGRGKKGKRGRRKKEKEEKKKKKETEKEKKKDEEMCAISAFYGSDAQEFLNAFLMIC